MMIHRVGSNGPMENMYSERPRSMDETKREYSRKLKLLTVLIKENELEDKARDEIRIQMKIPLESL
jgi:hypothetical protein